jgi:hypothetical protein
MRRRPHKLPSPATVIASIALLVALTGTSIAAVENVPRNSVGTRNIKGGAVTSAKIRNGTIVSADVRNRSLLRADFAPGQVPTGPTGPQGPAGPPGVSAREQISAETGVSSASPKSITATCPTGKRVLGGGVEISGAGRARVTATENKPSGDTGWEGEAFEAVATGSGWKLVVHAICANVS